MTSMTMNMNEWRDFAFVVISIGEWRLHIPPQFATKQIHSPLEKVDYLTLCYLAPFGVITDLPFIIKLLPLKVSKTITLSLFTSPSTVAYNKGHHNSPLNQRVVDKTLVCDCTCLDSVQFMTLTYYKSQQVKKK